MKKIFTLFFAVFVLFSVNAQVTVSNVDAQGAKISPDYVKVTSIQQVVDLTKGLKNKGDITVVVLSPDGDASNTAFINAFSAYTDLIFTSIPQDMGSLSLADLSPHSVLILYNDLTWDNANTNTTPAIVGDIVADYIDAGGKVVDFSYTHSYDAWAFGGRYITDGYSCFSGTTDDFWGNSAMGTVHVPGHPVMTGVSTATQTFGGQNVGLASGATQIADWDNGEIFVAANENTVGLNFMPVDPEAKADVVWGGDMVTLIYNSIVWLGEPAATYTVTFNVDDGTTPIDGAEIAIDGGTYTATAGTVDIDLEEGTYTFTVTADGYDDYNDTYTVTTDAGQTVAVHMDEEESVYDITAAGISIYPNPSNGVFNVNVENNFNLEVLDITGKVINTQVLTGNSTVEINTAGVYFFRFSNENGSVTQRVIVQ